MNSLDGAKPSRNPGNLPYITSSLIPPSLPLGDRINYDSLEP